MNAFPRKRLLNFAYLLLLTNTQILQITNGPSGQTGGFGTGMSNSMNTANSAGFGMANSTMNTMSQPGYPPNTSSQQQPQQMYDTSGGGCSAGCSRYGPVRIRGRHVRATATAAADDAGVSQVLGAGVRATADDQGQRQLPQ